MPSCLTLLTAFCICGCGKLQPKSLPAPLRKELAYEIEGTVGRLWGGDSFEFGKLTELHYIVIQGVDTPKPGQPFYTPAREHLTESTRDQQVLVKVVDRDKMMREIGDVFVIPKNGTEPINVGLDLINKGFGWFDGNEFEDAELFRAAEAEAREKKIGLWAQDNPIAPSEFEQQ